MTAMTAMRRRSAALQKIYPVVHSITHDTPGQQAVRKYDVPPTSMFLEGLKPAHRRAMSAVVKRQGVRASIDGDVSKELAVVAAAVPNSKASAADLADNRTSRHTPAVVRSKVMYAVWGCPSRRYRCMILGLALLAALQGPPMFVSW